MEAEKIETISHDTPVLRLEGHFHLVFHSGGETKTVIYLKPEVALYLYKALIPDLRHEGLISER